MLSERLSGVSCGSCVSRRRFLTGCAACAAGAAGLSLPGGRVARAAEGAGGRPKVRLVYTYLPSDRPIWPNIGYDFEKRKKELTGRLVAACPEIDLSPVDIHNAAEAKKMLAEDKDVDGYLVWMLGLWTGAPQVIAAAGKPTVFADDLYGGSGEFLIANAVARRNNQKVACVSSSRVEDVAEAARCFTLLRQGKVVDEFLAACKAARLKGTPAAGDMTCKDDPVKTVGVPECLKKLRDMRLLTVGGGWGMPGSGKSAEEVFGLKVIPVDFKELDAAYGQADKDESARIAESWMKTAEKVIEPKAEDIRNSAAMYLGMQALLKKHGAQGITINCLGGFYGGHLRAYPCLGFVELNDAGLVGGCESDVRSAVTMMVGGALTGRPGFISDPVIDTSKNRIIYAHCVAPTKVFGPAGPANPYHIRSHSEDRKGAAARSLMPLGYMTTTLEIEASRKAILVHQGKTVENVDEDMACRTKLAAEVKGDIDKLLSQWDSWGWHRVTFYGDLLPQVRELAEALKFKVVEEA